MNEAGASHVPPDDPATGDSESDLPAPDWYPDPWDPDRALRWWDGAEWTGHTAEIPGEGGESAGEVAPDAQTEPTEPSLGAEEPASSQVEVEEPAYLPTEDEEPAGPVVEDEEPGEPLVEPEEPLEPEEPPADPAEPERPAEPAVEPEESAELPAEPETPAEPVPEAPPAESAEEHEDVPWSPEAQDDSTGAPPGWEDRPRVMVHGERPQATGGIPKEVAMIAVGAVSLIVLLLLLL